MAKQIVYGDSSRQGILRGINSLAAKARYVSGEMEHLRLREFEPGICRYVNERERTQAAG